MESNPGPANDSVKCVCSFCDESGLMLQCEMCSNRSHCECVKVSPVTADNLPYICLSFCITSYLSLISDLRSEISHLTACIIRLEKSCSSKSQPLVRSLSVSFSSPFRYLITLPLLLLIVNTSNFQPPSSNIYPSHFVTPLLACPFPLLLLHPFYLFILPLLLLIGVSRSLIVLGLINFHHY